MHCKTDFTIEPFKRKPKLRSDKGRKHDYPNERKQWNLLCHGQGTVNLNINQASVNSTVMDTAKAFKHSAELREYWRLEKRRQRARTKK